MMKYALAVVALVACTPLVAQKVGRFSQESKSKNIDPCAEWEKPYLSNAFTPNGDHIHEDFRPELDSCTQLVSFTIFNRWGEKIFESNEPDAAWDGTYKERAVSSEVYVWVVEYTDPEGNLLKETGHVSVIR